IRVRNTAQMGRTSRKPSPARGQTITQHGFGGMLNNKIIMSKRIFLFTVACLWLMGCGGGAPYRTDGFVQVDGTVLRDSLGRSLILRGLNYVNKDKENRHLNLIGDTAFREMKNWGYNSVRLGVNWAALEPSPHRYDSTYLRDL